MTRSASLFFLSMALGPASALAQIPATVTTERIIYSSATGRGDSSTRHTDTLFLRSTITSGGIRRDYVGSTNSKLPMLRFGSSEIMQYGDSGFTVMYLDPREKTYFLMRPIQLLAQSRKMLGSLGMSSQLSSATSAVSVDSIGAGDIVDGYKTVHFRTHLTMRMSIGLMADIDTVVSTITTDVYLAPDFKPDALGLDSSRMEGLKKMGSSFAEAMPGMQQMAAQLGPAYARLAKLGGTVRTVISSEVGASPSGDISLVTMTETELVKSERTTVSPSIFGVPADYKMVDPFAAMMAKSDSLLKTLQSLRKPF